MISPLAFCATGLTYPLSLFLYLSVEGFLIPIEVLVTVLEFILFFLSLSIADRLGSLTKPVTVQRLAWTAIAANLASFGIGAVFM